MCLTITHMPESRLVKTRVANHCWKSICRLCENLIPWHFPHFFFRARLKIEVISFIYSKLTSTESPFDSRQICWNPFGLNRMRTFTTMLNEWQSQCLWLALFLWVFPVLQTCSCAFYLMIGVVVFVLIPCTGSIVWLDSKTWYWYGKVQNTGSIAASTRRVHPHVQPSSLFWCWKKRWRDLSTEILHFYQVFKVENKHWYQAKGDFNRICWSNH